MVKKKRPQVGSLPPQYSFIMNPYPDIRLSKCPVCDGKTGQRKRPLLIHIDPQQLIALNYTCRYCKQCDLLMAHKDEIEHLLTTMMRELAPELIGNNYLIIGTVEKDAWKAGLRQQQSPAAILQHAHDFADYYQELRVTETGWFPADYEPGIRRPPPSEEWVKQE